MCIAIVQLFRCAAMNASMPPTRTEDVVVGGIYLCVTLMGMALYMPCLWVMHTDDDLRKHPCFRVSCMLIHTVSS